MPAIKPMLAKDADPAKLRFPLTVQAKIDGVRALIVDGKVQSRNGKMIANKQVQEVLGRPEFEGLDGELVFGPPNAENCFQATTSFVRAENKRSDDWVFFVFDFWNMDGAVYRDRRAALMDSIAVQSNPLRIQVVAEVMADDAEELEAIEEELLAQGYEGAMVRDPIGTYKHGRSYPSDGKLLKLKRFTDFEAEVIGVEEEQTNTNVAVKNALGRTERSSSKAGKVGKGTLGKLRLRALNGPWEGVEFNCGTGFSAADRKTLWAIAELEGKPGQMDGLNGNTAKIKAFEVGAVEKPRFPVWLGWRAPEDMPA